MTTLTAPEEPRALAAAAPDAPRLRLRRAGRDEQIYPLEPGKWTIGSSPRCDVRLPASEAQPLQCLVTLEQGAAIVTRWAVGVLLNGREFSKKPLQSGDRLSIGPWEIEWQDRGEAVLPPTVDRRTGQAPTPPTANVSAPPSSAFPNGVKKSIAAQVIPTTEPAAEVEPIVAPVASAEAPPVVAPVVTLTTTVAPLETVVEAQASSAAPRPMRSPRPAAKTVLVASRKTDPCDQPLGPMTLTPATLVTAEPAPHSAHASEAFQDRLVVELWMANFAARSRTKALAADARTARDRANHLAAISAELESRLQEARALGEAQAANHRAEREALSGELTQATAECVRLVAELQAFRTASEAQSADLKSQHDALHLQLDQAVAERDRLVAEWDASRAASDVQAMERTEDYEALQSLLYEADAARERFAAEVQSLRTKTDAEIAKQEAQFDVLQTELNEATAARDRLATELSALQAQTDADAKQRQSQIESLPRDFAEAAAERDRLIGELDALRSARPRTAPPDPRLQTLADACAAAEGEAALLREQIAGCEQQIVALREQITAQDATHRTVDEQLDSHSKARLQWQSERDALEGNCRAAEEEAARLRDELMACETHIERLEEQAAAAEAARAAMDQQLADQQRQQNQWLAECQTMQTGHAAALADVERQRDALQLRLDELASQSAPEPSALSERGEASLPDHGAVAIFERPASPWQREEIAEPQFKRAAEPTVESAPAADLSQPARAAAEPEPVPQAPSIKSTPVTIEASDRAAEPAPAHTPTSFIDRYRHLLDDDAPTPEPSLRKSQPILDDEYLSPAQFDDSGHADNDSDEALEAYMSNMMRRVRSGGSNVVASMAPSNFGPQHVAAPVAPPVAMVEEAFEVELDANGMQRAVRKHPTIATNLAALREIANTSARTAIAQHRQRRHIESAVVKGAFFAVTSGAAAYLMLSAPGVESPWFWGGCVAMVAAGGAGAQLLTLFWRRVTDGRRYTYATAPSTATDAPTAPAPMAPAEGVPAEPAPPVTQ